VLTFIVEWLSTIGTSIIIFQMEEVVKITILFPNSIALDDIASRDTKARSSERDAESLRRELEMVKQARESTLAENRLGLKY